MALQLQRRPENETWNFVFVAVDALEV